MESKSKNEEGQPPPTFPELFYDMLEIETKADPNGLVRWVDNGAAFVVENKQPEINALVKKYFSHGKYTSLTRQFHHYQFKRYAEGELEGAYYHPHFHRDRREDLPNLRRRGTGKRSRSLTQKIEKPKRKSTRRSSEPSHGPSLVKSTPAGDQNQEEYDGSDISTTKENSTLGGGDAHGDDAEMEANNNDDNEDGDAEPGVEEAALKLDFKAEAPKPQKSTNKIILPFVLKKVMIQTWENINLRKLIPNLPAPISVRKLLDLYVDAKLNYFSSKSIMVVQAEIEKKKTGWKDLTDGVALFFDKALPSRLLYAQELPQFQALQSAGEQKRWSDIYGCEHLLRLLLRLPDILAECVNDATRRRILQDMTEFVRFLHQHKDTLCVTPFRALAAAELEEIGKEDKAEDPMS